MMDRRGVAAVLLIAAASIISDSPANAVSEVKVKAARGQQVHQDGTPVNEMGVEESGKPCPAHERRQLRIADLVNCMSRKSGMAVLADRSSMQEIDWDSTSAGRIGEVGYFKQQISKVGLTWFEYDDVVNIVRREDEAWMSVERGRHQRSSVCELDSLPSLVNIDFPEPTDIKDITRAISLWTETAIVLDRSSSGKVQLAHDRRIPKVKACQIWLRALNQVGLSAVARNRVVVLMPYRSLASWSWPEVRPAVAGGESEFDFPEFVSIKLIAQRYETLVGKALIWAANDSSKVAIYGGSKVRASEVPFLFSAALQMAGLKLEGSRVVTVH